MRSIIIVFLSAVLFSCEKKELPAPKYDRGDVLTAQVNMTSNYKNQVWFSLSENKIVSTNYKTDWDIAFESSVTGDHVILNSALGARVYKTNHNQLSDVTDTTGLAVHELVDSPTGNLDSTAIGDWQPNNTVYILNRGFSETGQALGFYKIKITSVSTTGFVFEYADIFGTQTYQKTVSKNEQYNFNAYSFSSHQQLSIEPFKENYDMCFTQFTHVFTNPLHYYQVTGVLTNSFKTRVTSITDRPFADITINDTLGRTFTRNKNSIGYDWKSFDLNTNLYTVNTNLCYIINDNEGFYYKLHFIDFYNSTGIKGYPTFEFKKL
ncbi:MAG: HmuY family protein [Bacteroidota bacterium]